MKLFVALFVVAALSVSVVLLNSGNTPVYTQEDVKDNMISVTGEHTIKVTPDTGYISFAVVTSDKDAKIAQNDNKEIMDMVNKALKNLGIAEKDIKTTNYSIYPRYEYIRVEERDENGKTIYNNKSVLVGYEVNNSIQVTVRDLDLIGDVIDIAVENGANNSNSLSFGLSEELKKETYLLALKLASQDAMDKAEAVAEVFGIAISKPSKVIENQGYVPGPIYRDYPSYADKADDGISTPISAGEMEVRASVSVEYSY